MHANITNTHELQSGIYGRKSSSQHIYLVVHIHDVCYKHSRACMNVRFYRRMRTDQNLEKEAKRAPTDGSDTYAPRAPLNCCGLAYGWDTWSRRPRHYPKFTLLNSIGATAFPVPTILLRSHTPTQQLTAPWTAHTTKIQPT